jgi:hypothetical protein
VKRLRKSSKTARKQAVLRHPLSKNYLANTFSESVFDTRSVSKFVVNLKKTSKISALWRLPKRIQKKLSQNRPHNERSPVAKKGVAG